MKIIRKNTIIIGLFIILVVAVLILDVPRKIMYMIYPLKYENFVELYSENYNVDKYLVYAIIKAESNFDETAVSSKGAKGLMQLMDNTAKYIVKTGDIVNSGTNSPVINTDNLSQELLNPDINIYLGTKYMSILIKKYDCVELALVAYNAGSGNVDNWIKQGVLNEDGSNIENVPYKETNNYVRKILRDYKIYKNLY